MRKLILSLMFLALALPAHAEDITATVIAVRDGDTISVRLDGDCLPKIFQVQGVRLNGCDTPEKKDARPEIAAIALQASEFTAARITPGQAIVLRDVKRDKYGGRLVASVEVDGVDLCRLLIDEGLAKPYAGGKKEW